MLDTIIPNHIGFIVDGNRRWAKKHGIPTYEGHLAGYNALKDVVIETFNKGVKYISVYAFSTENWKRDEDEVKKLMSLVIKLLTSDLHIIIENNIKLKFIGSKDNVNSRILEEIDKAETKTANNTAGTLLVCFNYGGQLEIVEAVKKIVQAKIPINNIGVDTISENIYEPDVPPVDLVVRTSGEQRISNFMLWRVAYSEMLFLEKLWPDMKVEDISKILREYSKRSRRFGV